MARHFSRLITILVRCMRLSFTGSAAVAVGDAQYAEVSGAGEVSLDKLLHPRFAVKMKPPLSCAQWC